MRHKTDFFWYTVACYTDLKSIQLPGERHMLKIKLYFELTDFKLMRFYCIK